MLHSQRKNYVKWITFFILMFLTEELASLLSVRKSFSDNLEGPKSPNYPLDINHAHNTDFNKLANFCQVKKFSHIFNHWYFSQSVFIFFFSFMSLPETRCYNPTNKLSLWTLEQKFTTGNMQRFSWSCCVFTFLYLLTNMFLYLN